jgi:thiamine-monophosphate kinase
LKTLEREFHHWLKSEFPTDESVIVGIGDDAAVVSLDDTEVVLATDSIAEGTHFQIPNRDDTERLQLKEHLRLVGRKALAVNLSDLAAMAARPEYGLVTFFLPRDFTLENAKDLMDGIKKCAHEFELKIVGGDTNTWDGPLVVGASVVGSRKKSHQGWSIGGAIDKDVILVSGSFGGSISGRHLRFTPRIELASYLSQNYKINAATDASDSLSLDLNAMIRSSGLGADIDLENIPISPEAANQSAPRQAPNTRHPKISARLNAALTDGEDFELILAAPHSEYERMLIDKHLQDQLTMIGVFTNAHQTIQASLDGETFELNPQGYDH